MNQLITSENINYLFVFLEGILSFLSPCILPLLPVYLGYLAGNSKKIDKDGNIIYPRKIVLINTISFVIGISIAFFILGLSFSALGSILNKYKNILSMIAGLILLVMGTVQTGIIKIKFLEKERKIKWSKNEKEINPLIAFIMGFTFSFAWTPCIGPVLASVLTLVATQGSMLKGNLLIALYTLGFAIPFLIVGIFTTKILNIIKKNQKIMKYTMKIAGIILIIVGIVTIINSISQITLNYKTINENQKEQEVQEENNDLMDAINFSLKDQNGNIIDLSKLKGKTIFMNFWATWCPPCKAELPHIQELYEEYGENNNDVIILGIVGPKNNQNNQIDNKNEEEIKQFLKENNITYPVLFDETGEVFYNYYIQSFPTTFMINKDGKIYGYVNGAMEKETMKEIIEQTK